MKYRFHLLGLVHLPCSKKYLGCAFSQKNHKLARMLLSLGHEVFYYGAEGSDVPCTKFIQTHTLKDINDTWGLGDTSFEIGYDFSIHGFRSDVNSIPTEVTKKYYATCINSINKIKRPDDFLLITHGTYQREVDRGVNLYLTCEPGIGYRGSYCRFRAFESSFIQNFTYGAENPNRSIDGSFYDRVVPNYFDPEDITFKANKSNYFLYIGRIIKRKGVEIAAKVSEALNVPLIIAGHEGKLDSKGNLYNDFTLAPSNWTYNGYADLDDRKYLISNAKACILPTQYLEPFAGTHVESMLSGTPIITTNFGVFGGDTFTNGIHGYKCDTLDDFIYAGKNVDKLDPYIIRSNGERFLMDNVKWEFAKWFEDLYSVYLSSVSGLKGWSNVRSNIPEWRLKLNDSPNLISS